MYDELVKELRDSAEWADRLALLMGRAEGDAHAPVMRKAASVIEELNKPHWIPVTERLPGSGVPTLICGDGNVVEQGFFDDEYCYWYDWGGNRTFVHHWMPLPEPPKEE